METDHDLTILVGVVDMGDISKDDTEMKGWSIVKINSSSSNSSGSGNDSESGSIRSKNIIIIIMDYCLNLKNLLIVQKILKVVFFPSVDMIFRILVGSLINDNSLF